MVRIELSRPPLALCSSLAARCAAAGSAAAFSYADRHALRSPMCRSEWGVPDWLQQQVPYRQRFDSLAVHHGVLCSECNVTNFAGSRFKCMICSNYDLCDSCFTAGRVHRHHPFVEKATMVLASPPL